MMSFRSPIITSNFVFVVTNRSRKIRQSKSGPRRLFIRPQRHFVNNEKFDRITKHLLIWYNVTCPETITLSKMPGPRTVVKQLMWPSDEKGLKPLL